MLGHQKPMTKDYLFISDFDQTLSFNDSGIVLSEMIGVSGFGDRIRGQRRLARGGLESLKFRADGISANRELGDAEAALRVRHGRTSEVRVSADGRHRRARHDRVRGVHDRPAD